MSDKTRKEKDQMGLRARSLKLTRETIRQLDAGELTDVAGGRPKRTEQWYCSKFNSVCDTCPPVCLIA